MKFSALPKNYIVINSTKTMKYNKEREAETVSQSPMEMGNTITQVKIHKRISTTDLSRIKILKAWPNITYTAICAFLRRLH